MGNIARMDPKNAGTHGARVITIRDTCVKRNACNAMAMKVQPLKNKITSFLMVGYQINIREQIHRIAVQHSK